MDTLYWSERTNVLVPAFYRFTRSTKGLGMVSILTKKRYEILNFISDFLNEHGYPPSIREIAKAVNLSSASSVHAHLKLLSDEGYIVKDPTKPRALKINLDKEGLDLKDSKAQMNELEMVRVPVVGNVAAGTGVLAEQNIEDYLSLPTSVVGRNETFGVKVRGDSMIGKAILDGDIVIAKAQKDAEIGDIVIAGINEDEATVKIYSRDRNFVVLKPANENYDPIFIEDDKANIFGKVVAVIRSL